MNVGDLVWIKRLDSSHAHFDQLSFAILDYTFFEKLGGDEFTKDLWGVLHGEDFTRGSAWYNTENLLQIVSYEI